MKEASQLSSIAGSDIVLAILGGIAFLLFWSLIFGAILDLDPKITRFVVYVGVSVAAILALMLAAAALFIPS